MAAVAVLFAGGLWSGWADRAADAARFVRPLAHPGRSAGSDTYLPCAGKRGYSLADATPHAHAGRSSHAHPYSGRPAQ